MSANTLKGFAELGAFLEAFPRNMQRNAIGAGLRAAARPIREEARRLAPKASGLTAKNIRIGSVRRTSSGTAYSITVRVTGPGSFIAYFQEYGVAPHLISGKKRSVKGHVTTGPLKIGDEFVGGVINHPGHAATPFMRPALDTQMDAALMAMKDRISGWIEGKTGFDVLAGEDE